MLSFALLAAAFVQARQPELTVAAPWLGGALTVHGSGLEASQLTTL